MKSLRPRTADAGLFVVLIASDEELVMLTEGISAAITLYPLKPEEETARQNLRVDLMQARYGNRKAAQ